jgi:transcriptional regulator with XRE-family HTH domain
MDNGGIGEKVREVRERQGLKVSEVARRAGLTVSGVTSIETGRVKRPAMQTVLRLASALGIDPANLLEEEFEIAVKKTFPPTVGPQGRLERALERFVADVSKEARHAKLEDLEHVIQYALDRADYWEQELERGRTKEYATYNNAYNLAVLAVDEFSSFNRWLLDRGPARPLLVAMEHGDGLEILEEYDALINALIKRTTRTQRVLFKNALALATTEAQRDAIVVKRQEMDASAQLARRIA